MDLEAKKKILWETVGECKKNTNQYPNIFLLYSPFLETSGNSSINKISLILF